MARPVIGITVDVAADRYTVAPAYADRVQACGGVPLHLPPVVAALDDYLQLCDGFILTGGDDPSMEPFGVATHPSATPLDPRRQAFEVELIRRCEARPEVPVLGVCLGMQLMALCAGGALDQHLPDTLPTAPLHWDHGEHEIRGPLGTGTVHSHHRQAITDAGSLEVVATAPDEVIEAIRGPHRPFYLGVQWHPERTDEAALGVDLIRQLVAATR